MQNEQSDLVVYSFTFTTGSIRVQFKNRVIYILFRPNRNESIVRIGSQTDYFNNDCGLLSKKKKNVVSLNPD